MYTISAITECQEKQFNELHAIRNLLNVREQMHSSNFIKLSEHVDWCHQRSESHGVTDASYLVFSDASVVGFFRFWFDRQKSAGNWSMYTDTRRNPGMLGVYCELNAVSYFFESIFNMNNQLIAEVKTENPIQSLHKKMGFVQESQDSGLIVMRLYFDEFVRRRARFDKIVRERSTTPKGMGV